MYISGFITGALIQRLKKWRLRRKGAALAKRSPGLASLTICIASDGDARRTGRSVNITVDEAEAMNAELERRGTA